MDKKRLKIALISSGIVLLLLCVIFAPLGIIGLALLIIGIKTKVPDEQPKPVIKENITKPVEVKTEPKIEITEPQINPEPVSPEQFDKMKNMCSDIHREYKDLLKSYTDADTDERVYILKECYRKLDVMETTINKYGCYDDIDTFDEREKIEKKAKSFINAYIKEERENGSEDYEIDITQFSDDLDFIWDYITEKDEKLNKI